jgi:membrane protease YdiL (CAAX protease family)
MTTQGARPLTIALAVTTSVITGEYLARHVVAQLLPVLSTTRVNDMLATGALYVLLSLAVARLLGRGSPLAALRGVASAAVQRTAWVGAALCLVTLVPLALLDHFLWGSVTLPSFELPWKEATIAEGLRWIALPLTLLLVNGLVVPIAEEWLWRGVIQPRLVTSLGVGAGVTLTAALFSVKHAVVDASLGRLLTIVGGGLVLGGVAHLRSWKTSAVSHIVMNSTATLFALLAHIGAPTCASPQPDLAPEVHDALDRALALIDAPDATEIQALFTDSYLDHFPVDKTKAFFERVHKTHGQCTWQCTTKLEDSGRVTGLLACSSSPAVMTLGVEAGPPHKVNYLLIKPKPDL